MEEKSKINVLSIVIAILSLMVSLSTLSYNIFRDNKESISLWCFEYHCYSDSNGDGYITSGTYIIRNNSNKNVSIVDAYITYDGNRILSELDTSDIFPLTIDAGESYTISIEPRYSALYLEPSLFEVKVLSSKQKIYSTKSN